MIIRVISNEGKEEVFEKENPITVEELMKGERITSGYPILGCLVNNEYERLDKVLDKDCTVRLCDIRDSYTNMSYQYSLSLLYRYAIHQLCGKVEVQMCNALSKGLFTKIKGVNPTEKLCQDITAFMKKKIEENVSIKEEYCTREELLERMERLHLTHTVKLVNSAPALLEGYMISIEEETDMCPVHVLPSCGYLSLFEVRRYRNGILLRFPDMNNPSIIPVYQEQPVLYNAFAEETRWDRITGISEVSELNRIVGTDQFEETVMVNDALHEKKIAEIANLIREKGKRIILIAGPSSSGKTSFAKRLCIQLRVCGLHPLYLGTDDYFVDRCELERVQGGKVDFEDLSAVDTELFDEQMNALMDGETVDLPRFDFKLGKKVYGERITSIEPGQPVVIEGIHGLNPKLTEMISDDMKMKIYISPLTSLNLDPHHRIPTSDARFLRRMIRDYRTRNVSAENTILQWHAVRRGEEKNIFPYCGYADVFFNTQCSYELPVLKKYARPLLEEIPSNSLAYPEAQRILKFLQFFEEVEDDSVIANNSIIREFIGGSVLVK